MDGFIQLKRKGLFIGVAELIDGHEMFGRTGLLGFASRLLGLLM